MGKLDEAGHSRGLAGFVGIFRVLLVAILAVRPCSGRPSSPSLAMMGVDGLVFSLNPPGVFLPIMANDIRQPISYEKIEARTGV